MFARKVLIAIFISTLIVSMGVYQAATQQLVPVLLWFAMTALCAALITATVKDVRGFLWVTAVSLLIACVAPASGMLTYSGRDEYWVALAIGLVCVWMPAMWAIGASTWITLTALAKRKHAPSP